MSKVNLPKMKMQNFDDLFGMNDETWGQTGPKSDNPVIEVNISELVSFKDHPFKVQDDEKMADMMESIKQYGVMHPIIARPIEDGKYEIIAGHRRKYACEKLGIEKIPVRVLELDDDNATILMVQTNFCQREELLPSEKAKGYRKEFDARKHQGNKGGYTAEVIGEAAGDSKSTVKRFIKLSYLCDDMLNLLDERWVGLEQGYDIAFLDMELQELICQAIKELDASVSTEQSSKLKEYGLKGELTYPMIQLILTDKKSKPRKFVMKADRISEYFSDDFSDEEIAEIIYGLLDKWKGGN